MRSARFILLITAVLFCQRSNSQLRGLHDSRESHLRNVTQLTFGGQNAECYWSFDGSKLTMQWRQDRSGEDQIFTMNADGSNKKMISNGKGRCTCSYFMPNGKEIIYSSTHNFIGKLEEPDRSKGYVWPIFPYYGIYKGNADGSKLKPLFPKSIKPNQEVGYNAESTISPDGKRIIFTSDKDGDLELYTMNLKGGDVKRITHELGYDGGAFFSPNSKMIVWRANHPTSDEDKAEYLDLLKRHLVRPTKMEIWVANADGSHKKQLTFNGSANFAPYFTPEGKRIIFASNMDDPKHRKFELYIIKLDGSGQERITFGEGFDSFPMFSPDGRKLVWASNRNNKEPIETNIFIADWAP